MPRVRGEVQTACKALRSFFDVTDQYGLTTAQVAREAKVHHTQITNYRKGHYEPTIMRFEEMVEALGGRVVIEFPNEV